MESSLEKSIKKCAEQFVEVSKGKEVHIISSLSTDGITSATIMIKTLKKIDRTFSLKITNSLERGAIKNLPKNKIILFLDLASENISEIKNSELKNIFIIDHHKIIGELPEETNIVNPEINKKEKLSSSYLTYSFCKKITSGIEELAKLAVIGMVGDNFEKEISSLGEEILINGEIKKKSGLIIYPSTRPLNKVLEFSSNPYIPEVTGNVRGVCGLLKESKIDFCEGKCKTSLELDEEEISRLTESIMLKNPKSKKEEIMGEIFLVKMFNKLEDVREINAIINSCIILGEPDTAVQFCMENFNAKKKAETNYVKYKQNLVSGLKIASKVENIFNGGLVIINTKEKIEYKIAKAIISILSRSSLYGEGTMITILVYTDNKIKILAKIVGRRGKNAFKILNKVIEIIGGEVSGNDFFAEGTINSEKEQEVIEVLKKSFEIEVVKV